MRSLDVEGGGEREEHSVGRRHLSHRGCRRAFLVTVSEEVFCRRDGDRLVLIDLTLTCLAITINLFLLSLLSFRVSIEHMCPI